MSDPQIIAKKLLDAHVAHQLSLAEPALLSAQVDREVAGLFQWLAQVRLEDLVKREQITGVIERYVIDLQVSGAFAELAGEMARLVLTSRTSERTRVDEVLRTDSYGQFADKLCSLEPLWRKLIQLILHSDSCAALLSRTLQRGILDAILPESRVGGSALASDLYDKVKPLIAQRAAPFLFDYLEAFVKRVAQHNEERLLLSLDPEATRSLVDDIWDGIAPMKLSEAFALIGTHDLDDFVVLGYEFWLRYRKTPYFRDISTELVGAFFDKYQSDSVATLLDELGIGASMVAEEAKGFLGPLLSHATLTGFLEARLRENLAPFYRSQTVVNILDSAG